LVVAGRRGNRLGGRRLLGTHGRPVQLVVADRHHAPFRADRPGQVVVGVEFAGAGPLFLTVDQLRGTHRLAQQGVRRRGGDTRGVGGRGRTAGDVVIDCGAATSRVGTAGELARRVVGRGGDVALRATDRGDVAGVVVRQGGREERHRRCGAFDLGGGALAA